MLQRSLLALTLGLFTFAPAQAQILVGDPADNGNCFPFGCTSDSDPTRYQQVYDASSFSSPYTITGLSFFLNDVSSPAAELNQGVFDFYLSTTSAAVNGLSSDMDVNVGADNALFGSYVLGGSAPSTLTFSGGPFYYDPSLGNLLMDIRISGFVVSPTYAYYDARTSASAPFSRMHDFNGGYEGYGLVTEFSGSTTATVPEPASALLLGSGLLGLAYARRRRDTQNT